MNMNDLLDLVNKDQRARERSRTVQKFAVGMGVVAAVGILTGILFVLNKIGKDTQKDMNNKALNGVEIIKENVQRNAEAVSDAAEDTAKDASDTIKEVQDKTDDVKKDLNKGFHEISKDIHKTVKNISKVLKTEK